MNIMEKDSNTLYGYIYSMSFAKFFLQATTWIFGYSVARMYLELPDRAEIPIAALFGIVLSFIIDGPLSLLLKDLLQPGRHPAYKWAMAVGFSILTGATTFVSGVFLGEAKASGMGNEDRSEILSKARDAHEKQLSRLDSDIDEIQGKITSLNSQYQRDTALIISNMTPNHRMLYRTGKYKPYLRSSSTLKENVGRINALSTALQLELSSVKGRRYTITKARDQLAAIDPEASGKEKLKGIDAKNAKMGALISGSIYIVDVVAILLTWALFFLIRDKVSAGAKLDIETSSLTRWLLDRAAILQNKLLSAFSGADDEIADATRMFISIPVGIIQLLAWIAGLFAMAVTAPTRMYKPRPLMKKARLATPPDQPQPSGPILVRANNQYDAYEMQRRIEMQDARMETIRQEQEAARQAAEERNRQLLEEQRRQIEEKARQKEAALLRQIEERNRQIEEEQRRLFEEKARQKGAELSAKKAKKKTDKNKPKPLSNKGTGEVSAKIVGNSVEFDGIKYNLSNLSKLTDRAATVYYRQFASKTVKGKKDNADRWNAILPILKDLEYKIEYREGHKVSITGGRTIKA